jgi:hypothetical protein
MLACAGRLDRRIEGEQVGLVRDAADRAGDLADILRPALELGDDLHRRSLTRPLRSMARTEVPICTAVSVSTSSADSVRRREMSAWARAMPRLVTTCLMAASCSCEAPAASLGAARDLLHGAAQFLAAAAEASVRPLASSSVAAASRSAMRSCGRAEARLAAPLRTGALEPADGAPGAGALAGVTPAVSLDFLTRAMGFPGDVGSPATGRTAGRAARATLL